MLSIARKACALASRRNYIYNKAMHNANLLIANATGDLTPHLKKIHSAFHKAGKTCSALLDVDDIDIICTDEPEATIPEIGMSGLTTTKHLIYFPLDSAK